MYLVAIAWIYVVLMMAVVEAVASNGSILGALVTFVLYGVLPVSIVLYLLGAPLRGKARRAQEQALLQAQRQSALDEPDAGGHASADAVAPVREKL